MITLQDNQVETMSLLVDAQPIGLINYEIEDGIMLITHTEVDTAQRGKGYAEFLVASAVQLAILQGYKPGATCPYAVKYFEARRIQNNGISE